jgi:hypothetical protein
MSGHILNGTFCRECGVDPILGGPPGEGMDDGVEAGPFGGGGGGGGGKLLFAAAKAAEMLAACKPWCKNVNNVFQPLGLK